MRFLSDLERLGKSSPHKYPILACVDRKAQISAWNEIRSGLWSADQEVAFKALSSAWHWQRGVKRLDLEPMPANVLTTIVSAMAGVEGIVGYHGYWVLRQLIENECIEVEDEALYEIVAAVESAAGKLAYDVDHVGVSVSDRERRAHVRRMLAQLIVCLVRRGVTVGPTGMSWIGDAKEDSFVDIRTNSERMSKLECLGCYSITLASRRCAFSHEDASEPANVRYGVCEGVSCAGPV